jgi:hypothetical protein
MIKTTTENKIMMTKTINDIITMIIIVMKELERNKFALSLLFYTSKEIILNFNKVTLVTENLN